MGRARDARDRRIDAPAARLLDAVREATPAEAPLLRALFALRGLPAGGREPIWEQMLGRAGFVQLAEEPGREVVAGAIGRPWNLFERLRRGDDFEAFDEPGCAKMALGFHAVDGRLTTETRVLPHRRGGAQRPSPATGAWWGRSAHSLAAAGWRRRSAGRSRRIGGVDEPRPPGDEPQPEIDEEPVSDELEEPMPPIGATEPLGVIELLREEIGGRFGRLFRRR